MIHSWIIQKYQVCGYREPGLTAFCQPCKTTFSWCIIESVEPMGHTNQNRWDIKLRPMSISTYPVDCVRLCQLLGAQHYCLCSNGREGLSLACPPTLPPPHPPTCPCPYTWHPWYYKGYKKLYQKPAVNTARQS